jgi:hypothetical protein
MPEKTISTSDARAAALAALARALQLFEDTDIRPATQEELSEEFERILKTEILE